VRVRVRVRVRVKVRVGGCSRRAVRVRVRVRVGACGCGSLDGVDPLGLLELVEHGLSLRVHLAREVRGGLAIGRLLVPG